MDSIKNSLNKLQINSAEKKESLEAKKIAVAEKKRKKLMKKDEDEIVDDTVRSFNHELSNLFKFLKKKMPDHDDLRSMHNKFKLSRWVRPTIAIEENKDTFWNNKDLILEKNPDFFFNSANLTFNSDDTKEMHAQNSDLGEELIENATAEELEEFWTYLQNMLRYAIIYSAQTGDHL